MIQENTILENLRWITDKSLDQCHFRVHNVFNLMRSPNWRIPSRTITDWMLVYARGGRGYYMIDNKQYPIEEGRIYFVSNDILHCAAQEEHWPASVIAVRLGLYDNLTGKTMMKDIPPFGFSCKLDSSLHNQTCFENIYRYFNLYWERPGLSLCNTLISQIFHDVYLKYSRKEEGVGTDGKLNKAKLYIEENITGEIQLRQVAKNAGLSPKYFSKRFRQKYDMTFKRYVLLVRMNRAKFLLEETDYSIRTIAEMLGYSDPYIFSNQFKKLIGIPPSKVREKPNGL